jgi:hypothetical protein
MRLAPEKNVPAVAASVAVAEEDVPAEVGVAVVIDVGATKPPPFCA